MSSLEKKFLIGLIFTLVIIVFIPVYGVTESARQQQGLEKQLHISAERGAETFVSLCAACHGPEGGGAIGPALRGTRLEREALKEVVSKGRSSKPVAMPAWAQENGGPLKKHQVEDVVNFILNWNPEFIEKAKTKHAPPASAPASPAATVSPERKEIAEGKEIFASMGCSACHGPAAAGTNIAPNITDKTAEEITKQVRTPRTVAMPAYPVSRLSDEDLRKIIDFITGLNK